MPVHDRASIVCTGCHARKVKCDLQESPDGVCLHCRRQGQPCVRRDSVRKRRPRPAKVPRKKKTRSSTATIANPQVPSNVLDPTGSNAAIAGSASRPVDGFGARCYAGFAYEDIDIETASTQERTSSWGSPVREAILSVTQTTALPRPALLRAWTDIYVANVFHHCPVVDQADLSASASLGSMPLALALGLVGNLTRHGPSGPRDAADLYGKVKLLLAMDYESNRTKTLKTICLASCWSGVPSASAGLSGPWHWIGVGMRLALQIGLHRETSYAARPDAACLRRVFWHLHNSDVLQTAFSGRPPLLRPGDYDVSLPRPEDFETVSLQSLIFIESTKLWTVLGRASVIVAKGQGPGTQVAGIYATLVDWIGNIPADLHLYETSGCRKGYHRPTAELFIQYFVTIILTWIPRQTEKDFLPAVPPLTVVAASCVASLYDELNCRDEATSLLPLHGFFCLAALLPLVFHRPSEAAREMARRTKIGVLRSILVGMRDRYGDADMALRKIDALDKKVALYEIRDLLSLPEWIDHSLLFPFPEEMCDDMDLLPRTNTPHMEEHIESFGNLVDLPLDYSLLDLFAFDFSDLPGLSESDMNIDTNLGFM